jgi:putative membrane-bound dehydrogenase-like protein
MSFTRYLTFCLLAAFLMGSVARAADEAPRPDSQPLSPAESQALVHLPEGFELELVAAEPLVLDPVAIDWAPDGKLWVVEMADYPNGMDGRGAPGGRVRVLTDTNGDGKYDRATLFAEGLNFPNGLLVWRDGVIVTAAPEIVYLEDTDGDGRADVRETLYAGFQEGNQQLRVNGLRWGLDNWIYCASGGHYGKYGAGTKIKSTRSGQAVEVGSRDFRIRPDTGEIDPQSGPSQFGRNRDVWGNWFGVQNSYPLWHYVLEDHYIRRNPHFAPPEARKIFLNAPNPPVYAAGKLEKRYHSFEQSGRFTSACSANIYTDELLFPAGEREHAFTCEPFHNLVQHSILTPEGVSFSAERANDGIDSDFFASEDRWCRPVMVRTGPDGALWIVDMYRYMIEHPHWLPDAGKEELRPFYRSGEDMGRIYRVVKKGIPARPIAILDQLSNAELVAALDSPNDPQRDRVQQMLLWRNAQDAVPALRTMAVKGKRPASRMHALCTLAGLSNSAATGSRQTAASKPALDTATLLATLQDEHAGVRRQAVCIAEAHGADSPEVIAAACKLVNDSDAKVRMQLAATLGQWPGELAGKTLGQLAASSTDDPLLEATTMSSLRANNLQDVMAEVLTTKDKSGQLGSLIGQLLALSAAMGSDEALVGALENLLAENSQNALAMQFGTVAGMLDALNKRGKPIEKLAAFQTTAGRAVLARLEALISTARATVSDEAADEEARAAAVSLLARNAASQAKDLEQLGELLVPQTPVAVQLAVVDHLALRADKNAPQLLLAGWRSHGPAVRSEILDALLSRPAWTASLLASIEKKEILPGEIDAQSRQKLAVQRDARLRGQAEKLFATPTSAEREQIFKQFAPAMTLAGDAARGAKIFEKRCTVCHKIGDKGHEVGPNLASLTNKTPAAMLESILDPSRAVESKYQAYLALTEDGRTLTGLLVEETGSSLTLLAPEGKRQVLLRRDLEELRSTGKSLMPDGLEKDLTAQDLADLIQFVAKPAE